MSFTRMFLRPAALFAVLSGGLCAADADKAAPTSDEVVHLPKFEVVDSRLLPVPERW